MNEYTRMLVEKMSEAGTVQYSYQCIVEVPGLLSDHLVRIVGDGATMDDAIEDAYHRCVGNRVWSKPQPPGEV